MIDKIAALFAHACQQVGCIGNHAPRSVHVLLTSLCQAQLTRGAVE
jgi:hypothetical protein